MTSDRHHSGCCDQCLAELPDHWIADFWRYCPHRRAMSRRRSRADAWTIDSDVSPRQAAKHLRKAVSLMRGFASYYGLELAKIDDLLTRYRLRDPDAR